MVAERKALIVANDEYEHEGLRGLLSPSADAASLAEVLGDRRISDFAVEVVRNETAHVVQGRIEDLFADSKPDDVLLVHFSCHGLKSESGELYFAARNTRPDRLGSTAVPADFVQRCMRVSRSRSIVLLLDCCYGGAFSQGVAVRASGDVNVLDSFPTGRGRAVITASSAMEYAFEGARLADAHMPEPSVFTSALVEGLRTGEADRDEDGWIALGELYDYVFDRVRERNPNQTPSRDIEMQGELYLARSTRRRVKPLPVPSDLRAATTDANLFTRLGAVSELRIRLNSANLPVAAGAHEVLRTMAENDIRQVADAATAALADAEIRVSEPLLDFGQVVVGTPLSRTLRLLGPPLARTCTFEVSAPWIRVAETSDGAEIAVDTTKSGSLRGEITIKGQTGELIVPVLATVVADEPESAPVPEPPPTRVAAEIPVPHTPFRGVPPAVLAAVLLVVGVFPDFFHTRSMSVALPGSEWYVTALAVGALGASWFSVRRDTARLIGPGLLLGVATSASWGVAVLIEGQIEFSSTYFAVGYWIELGGHLALIYAGCHAWLTLFRDESVRLRPGLPRHPLAWIAVVFALVNGFLLLPAAAELLYHDGLDDLEAGEGVFLLVAAFLLAVAQIYAMMVKPLKLAALVLLGWSVGSIGLFFGLLPVGNLAYYFGIGVAAQIVLGGFLLRAAAVSGR